MISSTNYLVMKLVKTARAQDTKSVNDNSLNVLTETIRFRIITDPGKDQLNRYQNKLKSGTPEKTKYLKP